MKKGFTLIELLAVIVIVAIITLIATPIISNVVNNSKVGALKSSAYGLLEASNLYYAQNGSKGIRFDINDNVVTSNDTTKLLNYKGSIKRGTIIIDKRGNTTICITDGINSAYKNYDEQDVKTVTKETCNIPSNSSIVYLENGGATITELTNKQLTDEIASLKQEIATLKTNSATKQELETVSTLTNTALNRIYPVGSIYTTTVDDTVEKVQNRFGGTWESYGQGKTLVGVDTMQTEFNEVNKTGGEKMHTLTVDEMPKHNHAISGYLSGNYTSIYTLPQFAAKYYSESEAWASGNTAANGSSQPHNNLQPYITVYMYKRIS